VAIYTDKWQRACSKPDMRLRYGLGQHVLPIETFMALLLAHCHNPSCISLLTKRSRGGMAGLSDYDVPRRMLRGADPIERATWHAWADEEWQVKSYLMNVPLRGWRKGWKAALISLLESGAMFPGTALDEWLGEDSRKYAKPELRLFKRRT